MKKCYYFIVTLLMAVLLTSLPNSTLASTGNQANDLLMMAVSQKNLQLAQTAINNGANVNCTDKETATPLYLAIDRGSLPMVNFLLQNGALPNTKCKHFLYGWSTPLEYSITLDRFRIGLALLAHGADPNAVNKDNVPIIFNATWELITSRSDGDEEFYITLINKGANVNAVAPNGFNLLMFISTINAMPSVEERAVSFAKYLISKGMNPNYQLYSPQQKRNITALDVAIQHNATTMVNFLLPLIKK
jgi:ankyrin repeat protein